MSNQQGQCSNCQIQNAYSRLNCWSCNARLPWADAISNAAQVPSGQNTQSGTPDDIHGHRINSSTTGNPTRQMPVGFIEPIYSDDELPDEVKKFNGLAFLFALPWLLANRVWIGFTVMAVAFLPGILITGWEIRRNGGKALSSDAVTLVTVTHGIAALIASYVIGSCAHRWLWNAHNCRSLSEFERIRSANYLPFFALLVIIAGGAGYWSYYDAWIAPSRQVSESRSAETPYGDGAVAETPMPETTAGEVPGASQDDFSPETLGLGSTVAAQLDNGVFLGTVMGMDKTAGRYDIMTTDGRRTVLGLDSIRHIRPELPIVVGDRVLAVWEKGAMYPGTVAQVSADGYIVRWDDEGTPSFTAKGAAMKLSGTVPATSGTVQSAPTANPGFEVIRRDGTAQWVVLQVRVTGRISKLETEKWSRRAAQSEFPNGGGMINFYSGSIDGDHLIASYQEGVLYMTQ